MEPWAHLQARRAELENRYGIRSIKVFGSRARGDARPDSDLDVIIEADKPYRFDLLGLIALEQEMSEDLGINVDLMLAEDLKPSVAHRANIEAVSV